MARLRWFASLPLAILAAFAVLRLVSVFMFRFVGLSQPFQPDDFRHGLWWVGLFLMATTFVTVGVWVAPGRKDAVARIGLSVVGFFGALLMVFGALSRATTPFVWGACILLGGMVAYLPWRQTAT